MTDSKSEFRPGDRVRLVAIDDPYTRLRPGDVGTVRRVDDAGTVHVTWDSGSTLGIVPDAGDLIERCGHSKGRT